MDSALKSWLQDTGRDIARAVGSELKSQAKDKAVSLAKEQLGLGLADELKSLASDVGSELKGAAKKKAMSMAEDKLQELATRGNAGILCAIRQSADLAPYLDASVVPLDN